jgi:hypothetical protein
VYLADAAPSARRIPFSDNSPKGRYVTGTLHPPRTGSKLYVKYVLYAGDLCVKYVKYVAIPQLNRPILPAKSNGHTWIPVTPLRINVLETISP